MLTTVLLGLQLGTYVGLGLSLIASGHPRLGGAQLLLAAVQALVFGGGS